MKNPSLAHYVHQILDLVKQQQQETAKHAYFDPCHICISTLWENKVLLYGKLSAKHPQSTYYILCPLFSPSHHLSFVILLQAPSINVSPPINPNRITLFIYIHRREASYSNLKSLILILYLYHLNQMFVGNSLCIFYNQYYY